MKIRDYLDKQDTDFSDVIDDNSLREKCINNYTTTFILGELL